MKLTIVYYDRKKTSYGDRFGDRHEYIITGDTAKECMSQYRADVYTHDLFNHTRLLIEDIKD